jgi:hypothetical protein
MLAQIEVHINVDTDNLNVEDTKVVISVNDEIPLGAIDLILIDTFEQFLHKLHEKINKKINP